MGLRPLPRFGGDNWGVPGGRQLIPLVVYGWPNKPATAPAQPEYPAPGPVLVGNLGQAFSGSAGVGDVGSSIPDQTYATSFTTGPHPGGYVIHGVRVWIASIGSHTGGAVKAVIYGDGGDGPGEALHTLGLRVEPERGVETFVAPGGVNLDPNTTYWLGVELDHTPRDSFLYLAVTRGTAEDPCAERGWSMGDDIRYRQTGPWLTIGSILKFAVLGEAVPSALGPVHEPVCGDLPADTSTTGRMVVDGLGARSVLDGLKDEDWFRVELEAGVDYQFDQLIWHAGERPPTPWEEIRWAGDSGVAGYRSAPAEIILYDDAGAVVSEAVYKTNTGLAGVNERIVIRPTRAGVYYIGLSDPQFRGSSNYTVLVRKDDYPFSSDSITAAPVEVGGLVKNYLMLMSGSDPDVDFAEVSLKAGVQYQFGYDVGWCRHEARIESIREKGEDPIPGASSAARGAGPTSSSPPAPTATILSP